MLVRTPFLTCAHLINAGDAVKVREKLVMVILLDRIFTVNILYT